jgi:ABC-2 type transport system ATP-binding protein
MSRLTVDGVTRSYGDFVALDDVSFAFREGVNVLLGPNGAGKTTLAETVAGLCAPSRGTVTVDGIDVYADRAAASRLIGLAPQQLAVYPTLTVRQNLLPFAALAGMRRPAATRRTEEVLALLGIGELADRVVATLSGGQQRCVHTAIALVHDPKVVLLDEPTTGVDVEHRHELLAAVKGLATRGCCVCYTTHYLAEVEDLDPVSVVVIDRGHVLLAGRVSDLARRSATTVELGFDGPAPAAVFEPDRVEVRGDRWFVATVDPTETLARLITQLRSTPARLVSVEIHRPSLEAAFLDVLRNARETTECEVANVGA